MQIRQRLRWNIAFFVMAAAMFISLFLFAMYRISQPVGAAEMAREIMTGAFERVTLRNDYVQSGSERAKIQWYQIHEKIGRYLASAAEKFPDPADQKIIVEMTADQEDIGRLFSAIVRDREKGKDQARSGALSMESEARLVTQLNMKIYRLVSLADALNESARDTLFSTLKLSAWGISSVFLLLILMFIVNSWMISRTIAERIRRLQDGAAIVGKGRLDHRIDIRGDDELTALSEAFNAMTAKLQGSHQNLEKKIEEHERAEEELRQSREDLERAQTVGQVGSWRLDTRRNLLTWSDENHRIFGLPKGTPMSYETFLSTIHPDDRQHVDTQWRAGMRGAPYDIEHRIVVADQVKWVREKAYLEFDAARQLLGGFGITQDITARKQTEGDLKERTKQLEDANKELESFSYSVSHDLRTPLRAIDGYIRMILKKHADSFDEDARAKFEIIRDNARKMGQLIDELLAFSRLSRTNLSIATLEIEGLIKEVWEELKVLNPDRCLSLKIAEILPGRGDRGLVKQVLVNLLSNAIKFTGKREEALIEAGCDNSNGEIVYYIRDNGAGFDMHYYGKLFGVFQRLHSVGDFEGTGVGLAIVQRIINRHGGKIWAEGKVDEGATFFFTLPLQPE